MNEEKSKNIETNKVKLFFKHVESNKAIFLVFVISLLLVSAIGPLTAFGTDSTRFSAIEVVIYVLGATVITLFYRMIVGIISMFFIGRKSFLTIFMWVVAVLFFIFLLR